MEAKKLNKASLQEYLALLEAGDRKYDYHDGEIYAMAGGTVNHGIIVGNVFSRLDQKLRQKKSNCFPINSEVLLHIQRLNMFAFPDATVVCGPIERSPQHKESIVNPSLILEVLSKSTESYDRGDKFFAYRQIPSLKEYILIAQDKKEVDVFLKGEGNSWTINRHTETSSGFEISSLDIEVSFVELYRNVVFE